MKKIKFLVDVSDKYTNEKYTNGQVKEFNNERAEEILKARRPNGEAYAVLEEEKQTLKDQKEIKTNDSRKVKKTKKKQEE